MVNMETSVQEHPSGEEFMKYITETCFFGSLLTLDVYGEDIDTPVPLSVKMEELFRAAENQRESSPEGRSPMAGSDAFFATPFIPQGAAFRLPDTEEMRTGQVEDIIRNAGPFRPMDVIGIFEHSIREGPRRVAIDEVLAAARESGRLPSEAEAVLTELRAAVTAVEFQMQLQIEERDRERDERMVHLMDLAGRVLFGRASVARCHREGRGAGAP